ncbi:MAG: hypothetical protein HOP11_11915, partial [Saprospiraceae bacterium]|nr:hypothetical protein [Saprospiraceae bacterium]
MRLFILLLFSSILITINSNAQSTTFKCLEGAIYDKGCITCDNVRTGKMISGIETTVGTKKTELLNPIVVKYDSANVILIDHKFTTSTLKLSNTVYPTIVSLLKDLRLCINPDGFPTLDIFSYTNDTLNLSIYGDSIPTYKVYIPSGGGGGSDDQKVDTFEIVSNKLRLSLEADGERYKETDLLPYLDNTDSQTLSWNSGTGNVSISGGNSVNLDGRYLTAEVDGSINNELQTVDTFVITTNQLRLSLSQDAPTYTVNLNPYLDNTDSQITSWNSSNGNLTISGGNVTNLDGRYLITEVDGSTTNEIQTISASGSGPTSYNIDLSLTGGSITLSEGSGINLTRSGNDITINSTSTGITDLTFTGSSAPFTLNSSTGTDVTLNQSGIITLSRSGNEIIIGGTATDDQNLSFAVKSGDYIPLEITDGAPVNFKDGTNVEIEREASNFIKFHSKPYVDSFYFANDTLHLSVFGDGKFRSRVYMPNVMDTDDQNLTFGSKSGNDVPLEINDGSDVTITQGTNIVIDRNSATQITINSPT